MWYQNGTSVLRRVHLVSGEPTKPSGQIQNTAWSTTLQVACARHLAFAQGLMQSLFSHEEKVGHSLSLLQPAARAASVGGISKIDGN